MSTIFPYAGLRRLTYQDLLALYRETQTLAANAPLGSPERRTAIANLSMVQRALSEHHRPSGPSP